MGIDWENIMKSKRGKGREIMMSRTRMMIQKNKRGVHCFDDLYNVRQRAYLHTHSH